MSRVILGFSGGVDSFVAAYILKSQGYEVLPVHFLLSEDSAAKAEDAANLLSLKLRVFDLKDVFKKKVIDKFIAYYKSGLTPNPCAVCNRDIKFAYLQKVALELDADFIATGHYARCIYVDKFKKKLIFRGRDSGKDQSYFLALLKQEQFQNLLLPLGEMSKDEVIKLAQKLGFKQISESQDVCFLKGSTLKDFLKKYLPTKPGDFVFRGKKIGTHSGSGFFTLGQRRGLGVSWREPLYVKDIDVRKNRVYLGTKKDILVDSFLVRNLRFFVPAERIRLEVQVRYRSKPVPVREISFLKNEIFLVKLTADCLAPAPGQVCAIYSGDLLAGGGEITKEG